MFDRVDKLVYYLKGTSMNLDEVCEDLGFHEESLTLEELELLDSLIFQCSCGWWCDIGEKHTDEFGECYCDDCWEEQE